MGKMLGNSAAMTVYFHAMRMFANAFNNTRFGGDARPWAAQNHPNISKCSGHNFAIDSDADTYSNLIHEDLSVEAIKAAHDLAKGYKDSDGQPLLIDLHLLLVSPELEAEAKNICQDDSNNLQYMVLAAGGDGFAARQWAICDPEMMRKTVTLTYITRPTVMQTALDNPLKDLYTGYVDFGCGWSDAHQIIFSNPK